jgi:hypothetical protein
VRLRRMRLLGGGSAKCLCTFAPPAVHVGAVEWVFLVRAAPNVVRGAV